MISQKSVRVMPYMCRQQEEDMKKILAGADDIAAAAVSVSTGALGYTHLIETREQFKELLKVIANNYRVCVEEEVDIID